MLLHQWTRSLVALEYQEERPRMAVYQLVLRRTDQRVLRLVNDVRERLRCAERDLWDVHLRHIRSFVFLYPCLRRAYRGLRQEAFTSQASARQQGFFSNGLKKV
jgi:hypothetical protein